jgi:hypothetical protein
MAGKRSWKRILLWVIGIAAVLFILIQLVPYGRSSHSNPAATTPFQWTDAQAETIARESCYDCHSNETRWWWATNIAPFSWLIQRDVDEGRAHLNFSEFAGEPSTSEFAEVVGGGEMPPIQYTLIHPGAKLSDAEQQTLIAGYEAGVTRSGSSAGDQTGTPSPTPSPTASATTDATTVIDRRCDSCHPADRALNFRADSEAEAQALIADMMQRGAQATTEEQRALVQHFTR